MFLNRLIVVILSGMTAVAWGAALDRSDLSGTWQLDPALSQLHSRVPAQLSWEIEQSGNTIHLVQHTPERKNADEIRCSTDGHDCKAKDEGRSVVVSFYYNGAALVELETEGQNRDVTKKRMQVSEDGNKLTVDIVHIVPTGKLPDKLVLTRQSAPRH